MRGYMQSLIKQFTKMRKCSIYHICAEERGKKKKEKDNIPNLHLTKHPTPAKKNHCINIDSWMFWLISIDLLRSSRREPFSKRATLYCLIRVKIKFIA